jgi:integration host factor subunit alpha
MTLTKSQIVDQFWNQTNISKHKCVQIVETVFETVKRTLESNEDVLVSGFGKLRVKEKNPRRGRDPQTSDNIVLDGRKVILFKASGNLREMKVFPDEYRTV